MLVAGLDSASDTRATVLRKVAEYAFLRDREVNSAFGYTWSMRATCRRDADVSGFNFWLRKLNEFNGNLRYRRYGEGIHHIG